MKRFEAFLEKKIIPKVNIFTENRYLSAVRTGMVATVPFTISGSIFMIICYFPVGGWTKIIAPYHKLLYIPVTATFGCLGIIVTFAIAYDLSKRYKMDAVTSAILATLCFLLINIDIKTGNLATDGLGVQGLFTGIIIAFIAVEVQRFLNEKNLVIRLPDSVPDIVVESFAALVPFIVLLVLFWVIRFVLGFDIEHAISLLFSPLVFALNTLWGILVFNFMITLLWSVGINGDMALSGIGDPIVLMYLSVNTAALAHGQSIPYITAAGFSTSFVMLGGTGATIGLALVLLWSKEPGLRKVSRMAFIPSLFNINEPIFFGIPIVLNPLLMIPYIFNVLFLTAATYLLMFYHVIGRPVVMVPWTTPPIISQYLVTGGDWRAAVWGAVALVFCILIYYPFAKLSEKQRLKAEAKGAHSAHV
ncbi:MAG TPA: PTS transporter subunit EIIC [Victivallales bacterium]|nr:PTS transporter subunit EIIC [Victivallales bacterium]